LGLAEGRPSALAAQRGRGRASGLGEVPRSDVTPTAPADSARPWCAAAAGKRSVSSSHVNPIVRTSQDEMWYRFHNMWPVQVPLTHQMPGTPRADEGVAAAEPVTKVSPPPHLPPPPPPAVEVPRPCVRPARSSAGPADAAGCRWRCSGTRATLEGTCADACGGVGAAHSTPPSR